MVIIFLLLSLYGVLHLSSVQTWIAKKYATSLSADLKTTVRIEKVEIRFFDRVRLWGVFIGDKKKDTLLSVKSIDANLNDWFFLKDKIILKSLALNQGVIYLNRDIENWNYEFILDYLNNSSDQKKNKKRDFEFQANQITLNNIHINQSDKWIGQSYDFSCRQLNSIFEKTDLKNKIFIVRQIQIKEPVITYSEFSGNRNTYQIKPNNNSQERPFKVQIKKLSVSNGSFQYAHGGQSNKGKGVFDEKNILFQTIDGEFNNIEIDSDKIAANVNMSTREKCGLNIKKIKTDFLMTPHEMEFKNLDLQLNNSHIKNYFSMKFQSFNKDMRNFLSNVEIESKIDSSQFFVEDLKYFTNHLRSLEPYYSINGHIKGTINNLHSENIYVANTKSYLKGSFDILNLPDISNAELLLDIKSSTLHSDNLRSLLPSFSRNNSRIFDNIGNIQYAGKLTGNISKFSTKGRLTTQLGEAQMDIALDLSLPQQPSYSGNISTNNFYIGKLINNDDIGRISLTGQIKGDGFKKNNAKVFFDGIINQIDFKGYQYQQIVSQAKYTNNSFEGRLNIADPNLAIKNLEGTILFNDNDYTIKGNANLQNANVKNLHWSNEPISFSGLFNLNLKGKNIDDFIGDALIYNASIKKEDTQLNFDTILLSSILNDFGEKSLRLKSDEIAAEVNGQFKIKELPDALRYFLHKYYPLFFTASNKNISQQDFRFSLTTKNIRNYLYFFDSQIQGGDSASISGKLNISKLGIPEISFTSEIPTIQFQNKKFVNIQMDAKNNFDTLETTLSFGEIYLTDSIRLPETKLQITSHDNLSKIHLFTKISGKLNEADLTSDLTFLPEGGLQLHLYPSSIILNKKKWITKKEGDITLINNNLHASEISFSNDNQQITIGSQQNPLTHDPQLIANLKNVNIEDFSSLLNTKEKITGKLNGQLSLNENFNKNSIQFSGKADNLILNDERIGNVLLNSTLQPNQKKINFLVNSSDSINSFSINGNYDFSEPDNENFQAFLSGKKIQLSILEPYLGGIFSSIEGIAESDLSMNINKDNQYLKGNILVKKGALKVGYTQCRYFLENQAVTLGENSISLDSVIISDSLKNEAIISGQVSHNLFSNFYFNSIKLKTKKLALLNTNEKNNSVFYGNILGEADMKITGPLSDLKINIEGRPSESDSSHVYLVTDEGKESTSTDYIDFKDLSGGNFNPVLSKSNNIVLNLKVKGNPNCKVDVIIDKETGDIIKCKGTGDLAITVGNIEPLSISGEYTLTEGEYTFNFQTFVKKPFILKNNGKITWDKDPYDATIDIEAVYESQGVDISSLSPNGGFKEKENINIISTLSGSLMNPIIKFRFELPVKSEAKRDEMVVKRLEEFRKDENEMNKQVASLLLFNSFIIGNQNFLSQTNASSFISNSIGGIVSSMLTNFLNKELTKATKGILSPYVYINPIIDMQRSASQIQAQVKAGLKIFLSSRLEILVGGMLDYNNPTYLQLLEKKGLLTPDINIEWLINKDGSLRVVGFNKGSIDITMNARNRSGLQLSYRKEANRISDIFKRKKTD